MRPARAALSLSSFRPALRSLVHFDRSRITYLTALQNAIGVFLPLVAGAVLGHVLWGLPASIGALMVSFSDRPGPFGLRAARMLAVAAIGALSALVGGLTGSVGWLTVLLVLLWGLGGGLLVVYGPAAEQFGLTNTLLLLVYGGLGVSASNVVIQAGLVFAGGVLQTALSVVAWPLRRFGPERQALAALFRQLASYTRASPARGEPPPATAESTAARTTLTGLGSARSEVAESLRVLLDEAERIRLELLALRRLRSHVSAGGQEESMVGVLDELWLISGRLLDELAVAVSSGQGVPAGAEQLQRAEGLLDGMRRVAREARPAEPSTAAVVDHAEALVGQLRACVELVDAGSAAGVDAGVRSAAARSGSLRLQEPLSILRANLTLRSAAFRHAIRFALTLAVAAALARQLGVSRAYWVPLTTAIVLKPDFTSTFTRGVLRIAGTMVGLALATFLVHVVGAAVGARVVLIGVLAFVVRSVGPANFGVAATAITALVVFLISFVGASPESIIRYRAVDTLIGGLLGLAAYAVWPTWERSRAPQLLADMLDAYRRYFDSVMHAYQEPDRLEESGLARARLDARLARSNAEASVERMRHEPADAGRERELSDSILASSHRFVNSAMTLEAGLYTPSALATPPSLDRFVQDVDTAMKMLSSMLRDSSYAPDGLPDLRADQTALVDIVQTLGGPIDMPLLAETERITNSVNTMLDITRRSGAS